MRIGRRATGVEFTLLILIGAAVPGTGIALYGWPLPAVVAGAAAAALCTRPMQTVWTHRSAEQLIPALGQTARAVAVYGIVLGGALAWGLRPFP